MYGVTHGIDVAFRKHVIFQGERNSLIILTGDNYDLNE